jgi:thiol-disulfide isomerase/thioredoxin
VKGKNYLLMNIFDRHSLFLQLTIIISILFIVGCSSSTDEVTIDSDFDAYMDSTRAEVLKSGYDDSLQNELASIYFDYYLSHPDTRNGRDAVARTFLYWGNTGNVDRVTQAIGKVRFDSLTFERVHSYLSNAFYKQDPPAKEAYLNLLESLQGRVTYPSGKSEILYKLGEFYMREDSIDRAEEIFKQIITMNADSGDVEAAKGSLYEIQNLQIGRRAPDFKAQTIQGDSVALSDFRGKIVLLDFWATWCGPCLPYIPNLRELHEKYDSQQFQLIGIAFNQEQSEVRQMMDDKNMRWPQVVLTDRFRSDIANRYNINSIPQLYILDEEGKIIAKNVPRNQLVEVVGEILKK